MRVKLFQIAPEKDRYNLMFMNYEFTMNHGGIHEDTYELVFDGELNVKRLDSVGRRSQYVLALAHTLGGT